MTDLTQFDSIKNWKLLRGSHEFPGPDGGTCINEAAIVAAGFEYRQVKGANDLPKCFSRPVSLFGITLNDAVVYPDLRQELLPFVLRLAGSADTDDVERARDEHLLLCTVNDLLPMVIKPLPYPFGKISNITQINSTVMDVKQYYYEYISRRSRRTAFLLDSSVRDFIMNIMNMMISLNITQQRVYPRNCNCLWGTIINGLGGLPEGVITYKRGLQVMDEMLMMGNHSTLDEALAIRRMSNKIKEAIDKEYENT